MGKGSGGSGSASGSAGYSATGGGCSIKGASSGTASMYAAPLTGIEARLTITPLTANGAGYQPRSQQLYQPLAGSAGPYLSGSSPEACLAGSNGQYLTCPECGSDVLYGSGSESGSEMSPLAMSALARVMQQALLEAVKDFYKKACPACMTGKGMHTCGR